MKRIIYTTILTMLALVTYPIAAQASMRCPNGIISGGATTFEVLHKCGEPDSKEKISPALGSNGEEIYKSVTVENWVYGPSNGMYRFLKFIDGTLVKVESRRM
ncbi:MAG: DUF2845 domain-containing protein [Pseudomonas sp.]|nr:DUF2845 domain-containing protein [Pseudomonas sp.]